MDQLKIELLKRLSSEISTLGFTGRKKSQSFYKSFQGGRFGYHLGFVNHRTDFDITTGVSIRFDQVEDLINMNRSSLTELEKKETGTIATDLGNWTVGEQKRWNVDFNTDLAIIAESLVVDFNQNALPFFNEYSDMATVYDLLIKHNTKSFLISPAGSSRCITIIVMGYLLKDKELLKVIKNQKDYLIATKDQGVVKFDNFLNYFTKNFKFS